MEHKRSRPRIYVAGPYTASTPSRIQRNVARAASVGSLVAANGGMPFVPHLLGWSIAGICRATRRPGGEEEVWRAGGLDFLRDCDGLVLIDTWEQSGGSLVEHERALDWGIPIHYLTPDATTVPVWQDPALADFIATCGSRLDTPR